MRRVSCFLVFCCISLPNFAAQDLKQIYQTALNSDPVLKQEQANARAATAVKNQAAGALLPSLKFSADFKNNKREVTQGTGTLNDSDSIQYGLRLQQPIFRLDLWALRKQGVLGEKVRQAQLENAQQSLILRVSVNYFSVLASVDSLQFARAEKKAIGRQLEQVRRRFEVGLIAITDVQESKARYDLTVAQEIEAENLVSLNLEALREVTGQMHKKIKTLGDRIPLTKPEPSDSDSWVKTAMQQNPLINIAKLNLQIAASKIQQQRAGHLPSVDLTATYSFDKDDGNIFFQETKSTTIGITLGISLFEGGQVSARSREAQHLFFTAQELLVQQTRRTTRETRAAYLNVIAAISRVHALKQALKSSETALKATQAGFEVGTRTSVDILDSRRELFRSQRDYAQTRYDYILNLLKIKLAAGTLSVKDVDRVNAWLN